MPILFTVKTRGPTPGVLAKQMRGLLKDGFETIGSEWHRRMRPKHFSRAGAREYRYTPRVGEPGSGRRKAGSYTQEKENAFGHSRPLEFSGLSKRLVSVKDVRANSKGGRVFMNAPAFNFKNRFSKINMRAEMTTVSIGERDELVGIYDLSLDRGINAITTTTTKTIK